MHTGRPRPDDLSGHSLDLNLFLKPGPVPKMIHNLDTGPLRPDI